jgi:hypothetical protein
MTPILEGLDGVQKMSKSLGNAIGIHEPAGDVWEADVDLGRADVEVLDAADRPARERDRRDAGRGFARRLHPMQAKKDLAWGIVRDFHSAAEADAAAESWAKQFQQRGWRGCAGGGDHRRSAQAQDAKQIVQQAVNTQLAADRDDQSHWRYIRTEMAETRFVVVETENGAISRHIEENGRPASAAVLAEDNERIQKFIRDPALQRKQRRNGAHDDKSATELLNLMPQAFVWKVESETPETITLSYKPNSDFDPPDMEARVMGEMSGTLTVTTQGTAFARSRGGWART